VTERAGPVLEARDVSFEYEDGPVILKGVSAAIDEGDFTAIIGQNGSGKTTLAKMFSGLLKPGSGSVLVEGRDTKTLSIPRIARAVGFAFQNPDHQIFCPTVREELAFGPANLGKGPEAVEEAVLDALRRFKIEKYADAPPAVLGFGIRRKVGLAAIYAMRPRVMILDEPTAGLDRKSAVELMELMGALNRDGHTIILITHDMRIVAEFTRRSIVLWEGEVIADGPTREALADFAMLERTRIRPPPIVRLSDGLIGRGLEERAFSVGEFLARYRGEAY
jgi:energy-coupling factor transport system ATP-binding protein